MKLLKQFGMGVLVAAFLATSLLAVMPPSRATADEALSADDMCVPPLSQIAGNHFRPSSNWIQLRFINRATIQVVINPTGNCMPPNNGMSMENISVDDTTGVFQQLLEGFIVDEDTTDSNWQFREQIDGNDRDDSRLDNIVAGGGGGRLQELTDDDTGGHDAIINVSDLGNIFSESEYFLSFDNADVDDDVANCRDNGDDNDNFILYRRDGNMVWNCESSLDGGWTGIRVSGFFADEENFNITYFVEGSGTDTRIVHVSPDERDTRTFVYCPAVGNNIFRAGDCSNDNMEIRITPDQLASQTTSNNIALTITDGNNSVNVRASGATASSTTAAQATVDPVAEAGPSCESEGGSFSWLLCPALELTSRFLQFIDNQVTTLLDTPEEYYKNQNVEESWGRMRNIAFIILIPVLLVMVIGTALGFGFLDAYTIKRALPRLLIAVIFISLSLQICQIAIDVGNAVGRGVLGLITGATVGVERISLERLFNPGATEGFLFTAGVFATGALALGMIPVILLFGVTAAIGLFTVFLLLAFRQLLLVGLTIIAPLAILAWIFPGNDKLWKLWYNSFSKLIFLFPIIMFLIGTGKVFAFMIDATPSSRGDTNFLETVLILVAYVGPYFFIPAMFKLAGAAFANIAGIANSRGRGVFDRLRKARSKQYKGRWEDLKGGNFYKGAKKGSGSLGDRLNKKFQRTALIGTAFSEGGFGAGVRAAVGEIPGFRAIMNRGKKDADEELERSLQPAKAEFEGKIKELDVDQNALDALKIELEAKGLFDYDAQQEYAAETAKINKERAAAQAKFESIASPAREAHREKLEALWKRFGGRGTIDAKVQQMDKEEQKHIMEDQAFNTWANFDDVAGPGAAVITKDIEGLRDRLMMKGVGTKTKLDAKGNVVADLDSNGNYIVTDQAKLDTALGNVKAYLDKNDSVGALRQMLREVGTFRKRDANGNEYEDVQELETNVGHFERDLHRFTAEPLAQALVKKAAAGGTYYKGNDSVWRAAAMATHGDGAANAEMAASLRGILVNAGRADQGGGSFGRTIDFMNKIVQATSEAERKRVTEQYTMHVIENSPASTLFHPSMKENYNEMNIIPVLRKRLEESKRNARGKEENSAEFREYMRTLAEVDNIHQMSLSTKPAFAKKIAEEIIGKALEGPPITYTRREKRQAHRREEAVEVPVRLQALPGKPGETRYVDDAGNVIADNLVTQLPSGQVVGRTVRVRYEDQNGQQIRVGKDGQPLMSPNQYINVVMQSEGSTPRENVSWFKDHSAIYNDYQKQFIDLESRERGAREQMERAARLGGGPGLPIGGGPPGGGPP